jgi:hypothetical protein
MAVFAIVPDAEAAVDRLQQAGLQPGQISLRVRTMTDDPPVRRVEPAVEVPMRRRDAQVAGRVARKVVLVALGAAVVAALIGLVIAVAAGFSSLATIATVVVAAVAGGVVGAVWGGEIGAMGEARHEEGVVVGVHTEDVADARRADAILREMAPLRMDFHDAQGRPIPKL